MAKKYFVGVDLGGTSMRAGVVAKDGTLLALKKRKTHPELGAGKAQKCAGPLHQAYNSGAFLDWANRRSV